AHGIQIDLIPFIFENMRLARDNPNNERPLNTIAAFKAIDHIDWESFKTNPLRPIIHRAKEDLLHDAKDVNEFFAKSEELSARETKAKFINVLLLELAHEWLTKTNRNPSSILRHLIDYSIFTLGKLPLFELSLAWRFLNNPYFVSLGLYRASRKRSSKTFAEW